MSFFLLIFPRLRMMTHLCRRRLRLHRLTGNLCLKHITTNILPVMFITWDAVREREREMHTHSDKDARTHTYTHKHAHTIQKEQFLRPLYTPSPKHIIYVRIMLTHLYILRMRICLRTKRFRVRVCAQAPAHMHTHFVLMSN